MKIIELNEQQVEYLKEILGEINHNFKYSIVYQNIAELIINKLEE